MRTNHILLAQLAFGVAWFAVVGCANNVPQGENAPVTTASKTVKDSALPAGWTKVEVQGEKMSISCAPGWTAFDPSAKDFDDMLQAAHLEAGLVSAIKAATANKEIKLLVFKRGQPGTFSPNINIIEDKISPSVTLKQLEDVNLSQLKGASETAPTVTNTKLAGVEAVCIKWQQPNSSGVGPEKLDELFYLLIKNGNQYNLTFTLTDPSDERLADAMAKTFSVG